MELEQELKEKMSIFGTKYPTLHTLVGYGLAGYVNFIMDKNLEIESKTQLNNNLIKDLNKLLKIKE